MQSTTKDYQFSSLLLNAKQTNKLITKCTLFHF